MPLIVSGWNGTVSTTQTKLITKVARLYGVDQDSELRNTALDFLDECVDDLNSHLWEFNKVREEGIPFVNGQAEYVLSATFYRESLAYLEQIVGGTKCTPLTCLPYVQFKRFYNTDLAHPGAPHTYTMFNTEQDGSLEVYPTPDAKVASEFTLTVEYYRRIPLVSEIAPSASLEIPREVEVALVYGAQKRMAVHIQGAGHPDVQALHGLEMQAFERMAEIDRKHPDMLNRFLLVDNYKRGRRISTFTDIFIKV